MDLKNPIRTLSSQFWTPVLTPVLDPSFRPQFLGFWAYQEEQEYLGQECKLLLNCSLWLLLFLLFFFLWAIDLRVWSCSRATNASSKNQKKKNNNNKTKKRQSWHHCPQLYNSVSSPLLLLLLLLLIQKRTCSSSLTNNSHNKRAAAPTNLSTKSPHLLPLWVS